jgi:hypothetical protein
MLEAASFLGAFRNRIRQSREGYTIEHAQEQLIEARSVRNGAISWEQENEPTVVAINNHLSVGPISAANVTKRDIKMKKVIVAWRCGIS